MGIGGSTTLSRELTSFVEGLAWLADEVGTLA